jgi:predicted Zn-dependent protease
LLGAAAGGDAAMAGVAAAQTLAQEQQVRFSRAEEAEADRMGIALMYQAGFDPNSMASFFEVLQRQLGHADESQIPAILLDHPVTTDRIAEARARAAQMPPLANAEESFSYGLIRERLRVLLAPPGSEPREYYAGRTKPDSQLNATDLYGKGLAMMAAGQPRDAVAIFYKLRAGNSRVVQFHTALAQAQLLAGDGRGSITTFERARKLFPRNVPLTVHYGEALIRLGDAKRAHEVLLDLFNVVEPTPDQARLIAQAANAAGDVADAYYYMAEYHLMGGELPLAIGQLQLALNTPNLTPVQKARFQARLEEIQRALPRRVRAQSTTDRERLSHTSW